MASAMPWIFSISAFAAWMMSSKVMGWAANMSAVWARSASVRMRQAMAVKAAPKRRGLRVWAAMNFAMAACAGGVWSNRLCWAR